MSKTKQSILLAGVLSALLLAAPLVSLGCPFCSAVSQTLRQEMSTMDAVVIAESIPGEVQDSETGKIRMKVVRVLVGEKIVQVGQTVTPVYYGNVGEGRRFLLTGVDPPDLQWSLMPVTERGEKYILQVLALPDDDVARLTFFRNYLEDEEPMLARDAYDEFAITPYEAIIALKDKMDHDQLVKWIQDPEMPADRKRLYLTMLGVCGSDKDLPMLKEMLSGEQTQGGLDAMIACYLTLAGEDGLELVNERFLGNKQAPYTETYSAIMAVRFHGTEGNTIARSALLPSLHLILDRPELADLVISDLARWSDWSQVDRLTKLFINATEDNNFVRVPVVNYLRACPLPEAAEALQELEKVDPESIRRSNIFFAKPIAKPKPGPKSSSSVTPSQKTDEEEKVLESPLPIVPVSNIGVQLRSRQMLASANGLLPVAAGGAAVVVASPVNRLGLATVLSVALSTMLIFAWLTLTSGAPAVAAGIES